MTSMQTHSIEVKHGDKCTSDSYICRLLWHFILISSITRVPYALYDHHEHDPHDLLMSVDVYVKQTSYRGALYEVGGMWDGVPTARQYQAKNSELTPA